MRHERVVALLIVFVSAMVFICSLIGFANKSYPIVGPDFLYYVPRLLDSYIHYTLNGFSIQWYTPSFGGGLPSYPNPQDMQFTLPEALMVFMDPWTAIWASTAVFILIGFAASYFLFEHIFEFTPLASAVGAIIFNVNGFVFSHAVVGHLGYQAFPLLPLILLGLFHPGMKPLYRGVLLALILSLNIHNGGFYVIVIYMLGLLVTIPILIILRPQVFVWKDFRQTLFQTFLITFLLSGSKLHAVLSFMKWFPRLIQDNYAVSLLQGVKGIFLQLFGIPVLITSESFAGVPDMAGYVDATRLTYGGRYGLWEFDIAISPATLALCGFWVAVFLFEKRKQPVTFKTILLVVISLLGLWLITELRLTTGFIYPYIRNLPVIKSLHVNVRFAAIYLLPISVLSAVGFNYVQLRLKSGVYVMGAFTLFLVITYTSFPAYASFPTDLYRFNFDISQADVIYQKIKNGETFSIDKNNAEVSDIETFQNHASSLRPYEPIFGYGLEYFHPLAHPGPVSKIENGYFNITNPASLVFPEENTLIIFERISADDQGNFDKFINHKQPDWKRPLIQKILDALMLSAVVLILVFIFINGGRQVSRRMRYFYDRL